MERLGRIAAIILLLSAFGRAHAERTPEFDSLYQWAKGQYHFLNSADSLFTWEGEYGFPDGYGRLSPDQLTRFAAWVSHIPLWHEWKSVGEWGGGLRIDREQISRGVHIPWFGPRYLDYIFPLRIGAEYRHYVKQPDSIAILPKAGQKMVYADWLTGNYSFSARGEAVFVPGKARPDSLRELYRFLNLAFEHSDIASVLTNCAPIPVDSLLPGDLLVGINDSLTDGRFYVVLNILANASGERLYAIATGCWDSPCDLHIPLVHPDRNNPWLTLEEMRQRVAEWPTVGFYRLNMAQRR